MDRQFIFDQINRECDRQIEKWGVQSHSNPIWHLILDEEKGEVSKAILEYKPDEINGELIQCAAVIVSWLMDTKREDI